MSRLKPPTLAKMDRAVAGAERLADLLDHESRRREEAGHLGHSEELLIHAANVRRALSALVASVGAWHPTPTHRTDEAEAERMRYIEWGRAADAFGAPALRSSADERESRERLWTSTASTVVDTGAMTLRPGWSYGATIESGNITGVWRRPPDSGQWERIEPEDPEWGPAVAAWIYKPGTDAELSFTVEQPSPPHTPPSAPTT